MAQCGYLLTRHAGMECVSGMCVYPTMYKGVSVTCYMCSLQYMYTCTLCVHHQIIYYIFYTVYYDRHFEAVTYMSSEYIIYMKLHKQTRPSNPIYIKPALDRFSSNMTLLHVSKTTFTLSLSVAQVMCAVI